MERNFQQKIGYNIHVISHFIQNIYNEKLAEYGLTMSQAKVIYFLAQSGEHTQTDLQNKLYIKPSSMNGILESLLKNALVEKRESPEDRRTKLIQLTEKGKNFDAHIWEVILGLEELIGEGFSTEEIQMLNAWLIKMKQNLTSYCTGGE
ncbi:MarR family winged helix-turn-helix transcriptional regulator [Thalassobacillus sp. CUG 92003]|uniref:MarR family winged helix-turn-helix transcriptional regulator n=1 Tax=Thalassobacillus sp. CUG 92003 TaxID=2736641 RepID=UPI0015E707E4|nr:MarR family transcriptional regulator [Thalassobacillus sp. CUG 92003]